MAEDSLPYINAPSYITKVLQKIKDAETPPRFSQDFLATTLQMPGGSPRPVIPFLKRTGFLATDGTPTDLYKRFRGAQSGAAAAEALRNGYRPGLVSLGGVWGPMKRVHSREFTGDMLPSIGAAPFER